MRRNVNHVAASCWQRAGGIHGSGEQDQADPQNNEKVQRRKRKASSVLHDMTAKQKEVKGTRPLGPSKAPPLPPCKEFLDSPDIPSEIDADQESSPDMLPHLDEFVSAENAAALAALEAAEASADAASAALMAIEAEAAEASAAVDSEAVQGGGSGGGSGHSAGRPGPEPASSSSSRAAAVAAVPPRPSGHGLVFSTSVFNESTVFVRSIPIVVRQDKKAMYVPPTITFQWLLISS